jgi:hypothetical protein
MNRELEKLLKEKWFLVAADLIAVLAILLVMPDKRDGLDTFLVICAILAASLIVVIPVLKDGGGKAERQAEQARLRAKLAEEIDLQRDNIRAGNEAMNRRIAEAEVTARKAAEATAAAVAQRASTEINALKAALAELGGKVEAASAAAGSSEALEELTAKVESLAVTVRALVADADDAAELAGKARVEAAQSLEAELKSVRDELKKSAKSLAQSADKSADKFEAELAAVREEMRALRANPPVASVPSSPSVATPEPEALSLSAPEASAEEETEEADDEEVIEEIEEEEAAPAPADATESATGATGTALIVNLMIGIGNKPFVRGTGPGLSRDKGVPMSFLGIGRWQWVSPDPEAPATVEVWKNDQSPMGEALHLPGGEPVEVDEGHFGGV